MSEVFLFFNVLLYFSSILILFFCLIFRKVLMLFATICFVFLFLFQEDFCIVFCIKMFFILFLRSFLRSSLVFLMITRLPANTWIYIYIYIYIYIAGKTNKIIYWNSDFHVFTIISQYFISVLTWNNKLEHIQLDFFYLRELLIIQSHDRCSSLKLTCWHGDICGGVQISCWQHLQRSSDLLFKSSFWFCYVTISSFSYKHKRHFNS